MAEHVDLLSRGTFSDRVQALQSLQGSAATAAGRSDLVALGVVDPLVAIAADPLQLWSDVGLRALRLMFVLGAESAGRAAAIGAGAVPALVQALRSRRRGDTQDMAAQVLSELAATSAGGLGADKLRVTIVLEGAVPPLVEMLSLTSTAGSPDPSRTAMLAAKALASMATYPGNSAHMMEMGTAPPLVALLRESEDPEVQAQAAKAIGAIAATNKSRQDLMTEGALDAAVPLLRRGSTEAAAAAAGLVAALAAKDPKDWVHGAGYDVSLPILPVNWRVFDAAILGDLVALLKSEHEVCKLEAAHALLELCAMDQMHKDIIKAGAVPPLVKAAAEAGPELRGRALAALRFLGSDLREELEANIMNSPSEEYGPLDQAGREALLAKIKHYCF